ncbi:MAG: GIY-YIG nuclease family protein [Dehalococcoidales bacterium]|jgi:predicted GIY-YIG superfamily endonuclease
MDILGMKEYFVYILSNKRGLLYTGVTNDLERRMFEHTPPDSSPRLHRNSRMTGTNKVLNNQEARYG